MDHIVFKPFSYIFVIALSEVQADIYLPKVNSKNTRVKCKICSKITIKTQERCHC